MKHIETNYRSRLYIERSSREGRVDQPGSLQARGLGCPSVEHGEIASAQGLPIAAGIVSKEVGGPGNPSAVSNPASLRALPYDEEFYEVFSEIRLP